MCNKNNKQVYHYLYTGALALSAAALLNALPVAAAETSTGFAVCDEYINVRAQAGTDSDVIGKLYPNGKVEILETSENGEWYHIISGNVDGYVRADLIATGEDALQIEATAGYTTAECGAEVLNVRADKSEDSEIVGAIYENREYEVVDDQGDWIKVITGDGTYGWVSCEYVYTSTEYGTAETLEEEQARLDEQWLAYLAAQDSGTGADMSGSGSSEYTEAAAAADTAWAEADSAQAAADAAAQEAAQAQAAADADYQSYLDAQAAADASGDAADTAAAQEAYQTYEQSQSAADEQSQASSDAQAAADDAWAAADDAQAAADDVQAAADTASYTEDSSQDSSASAAASSTGQAVANYACQFVGGPYVYGGSSLTGGADCSGFVMSVFANFGISLPHNAAAQSAYGTAVSADSLAPGDLVFYSDGSGISHVAIYIGGGSIVHAANSSSGICYGNVNYNTPVAYRRLV